MRILFINSIHLYGGGEVWMVTAARELIDRGHDVTIVCRHESEMLPYARRAATRVVPLEIHGDGDPRTIWKIMGMMRRDRIDVVLTNLDKELRIAGIASRLCHGPPVVCRKGIDQPLKDTWGYRLTYNSLAAAIVANSQATKRTLIDSAPWLDADRVRVIYNGVDPGRYLEDRTRSIRQELAIPDDALLIGFVGRLSEQKGIAYLLPAFAQVATGLPRAHLLIVGEGELRESIADFASVHGLGERIHLAGFRDDIPDVMRSIDVCVLPSLWEGFGIVLIEAMATAKPCITTRISSMPEIVRDGQTGIVVAPRDGAALAEAMLTILENPEQAARMGAAGRQVVQETFTIQRMIDEYEQVFETCSINAAPRR